MSRFVDFKAVKAAVSTLLVLEHDGLAESFKHSGNSPQRALPASWGREPDAVSRLAGKELLELFRHLQGWRKRSGFRRAQGGVFPPRSGARVVRLVSVAAAGKAGAACQGRRRTAHAGGIAESGVSTEVSESEIVESRGGRAEQTARLRVAEPRHRTSVSHGTRIERIDHRRVWHGLLRQRQHDRARRHSDSQRRRPACRLCRTVAGHTTRRGHAEIQTATGLSQSAGGFQSPPRDARAGRDAARHRRRILRLLGAVAARHPARGRAHGQFFVITAGKIDRGSGKPA